MAKTLRYERSKKMWQIVLSTFWRITTDSTKDTQFSTPTQIGSPTILEYTFRLIQKGFQWYFTWRKWGNYWKSNNRLNKKPRPEKLNSSPGTSPWIKILELRGTRHSGTKSLGISKNLLNWYFHDLQRQRCRGFDVMKKIPSNDLIYVKSLPI